MRKLFLGLLIFGVSTLAACQEKKPTYSYLMLHPEYLQRVYNQCVEVVSDPSLPCEIILRAQADFTNLTNQREQDPERFGARVLQAEENSVFLKNKYKAALQAYQTLGTTKPSMQAVTKMRTIMDQAQAEYENSHEAVKILLAVIAATSSV